MDTIAIIAGGGNFPHLVADAVRGQGLRVFAVAHVGETEASLDQRVDEICWIHLGQFGRLLKALRQSGARRAIMAGTIRKRKMFEGVKPDLKGLALMSKLALFHDDDILRTVAKEFADHGIEIISSTAYLPELLAPKGCLTRRKPDKTQRADIDIGWRAAKELGRLDIGQCVVVRDRTVVALEAIEGTNETILRGGRLVAEKAVVVKVSKPTQDLRFDVPSVGVETISVMAQVRAAVLAVEAEKTLLFDREEMIRSADRHGIGVVAL